MWRDDFDYDGMIKAGLKTDSSWSISDLQKLYDSMEDVNYHTPNKYLGSAIFALEYDMPDVAEMKLKKFHKVLNAYINDEELEEEYADGGETDSIKIEIEYDEDTDTYEVEYEFDDYEIEGVLEKYYTGRGDDYKFVPSYFEDEESEKYYDENWEDIEGEILSVFYSKFKKGGQVKRNKYGEGGSVENGNLEMMKNQAIQVKHHADELIEILKSNPRVDAWVVSLMDRATQNLSNITHYLDGELKHFAKGGMADGE